LDVRKRSRSMKRLQYTITFLMTCLLLLFATLQFQSAQSPAATLAPTGTLRAAFLGTNPVHGRVDAKTGAVSGPVADLVKELAGKLGVPFTLIPSPDASEVIAHLKNHTADIGF